MNTIKNDQNNGYIYIRNHESYETYNVCKIGKTINILEQKKHYIIVKFNLII